MIPRINEDVPRVKCLISLTSLISCVGIWVDDKKRILNFNHNCGGEYEGKREGVDYGTSEIPRIDTFIMLKDDGDEISVVVQTRGNCVVLATVE